MSDSQTTNIAELALDYERKKQRFENLGMMNTKTDPAERSEQTIEYHQADADMRKAFNALENAKREYAA